MIGFKKSYWLLALFSILPLTSSFASISKQKLSLIKLPPGFLISVYANNVPGARQMTLGDSNIVYVGTRRENGRVYALIPNSNLTHAKKTLTIAKGLNESSGVAFYKGNLYVSEIYRILKYSNITKHLNQIPKPETIYNQLPRKRWHGYRYIKFSPKGMMYLSIGMPCNTCNYRQTQPLFGTIIRMKPDGTDMNIYAKGIRNSVGFDWQPQTGMLWFTDNGQDFVGNNLPPDEINRAPKAGMDFGFPFFYGNNIPAPGYQRGNISPKGMTPPAWELPAHVAPLGMTFYTGKRFPPRYHNQLFVAEHGSWNRSTKVGYQLIMVTIKNGKVLSAKSFAKGWLQKETEWGRPVDVLTMPDGALLVSDDYAGVIYRIAYSAKT